MSDAGGVRGRSCRVADDANRHRTDGPRAGAPVRSPVVSPARSRLNLLANARPLQEYRGDKYDAAYKVVLKSRSSRSRRSRGARARKHFRQVRARATARLPRLHNNLPCKRLMTGTTCGRVCCTHTIDIQRKPLEDNFFSTQYKGVSKRKIEFQVLVSPPENLKRHPKERQVNLVHCETAEEGGLWFARWKTNVNSDSPLSLNEFLEVHQLTKVSHQPNLNSAGPMGPPDPVMPLALLGPVPVVRARVDTVLADTASTAGSHVSRSTFIKDFTPILITACPPA